MPELEVPSPPAVTLVAPVDPTNLAPKATTTSINDLPLSSAHALALPISMGEHTTSLNK